jgi:hypothetical protein
MSGQTGSGTISLTGTYLQDFDTLSNTAGSTTNSTLPTGWYILESGGGVRDNGLYGVDTGGSTTGDIYSYGSAGSTDRALGELRSGTLIPTFGASFTNDSGSLINSLQIAFTGEEWRLGTAGRIDTLKFEISYDATSLTTGTWTSVSALDFATPDSTTTGAKIGNNDGEHTDLATILSGLNVSQGQTFWIRWTDTDASGADDGLSIDNFSIGTNPVQADHPGAFSIADQSVTEGNSGTTPITFTVTREAGSNVAASVHYDVTLPGGSTGADASDFASATLSGDLSFAANETSKTITLNVAGDTANEANETFTVALSAPTNGATLADGTATGTILNDDAHVSGGTAFINEIHYDNSSTDTGEAVEIAGPSGTDLSGWTLVLYNGSNTPGAAPTYGTVNLSGVISNQDDGYGTLSFAIAGLQNGPQDGFALVDPQGHVVQFLSYEGTMTGAPGTPAAGIISMDIGVSEDPAPGAGLSLQLTGAGASYTDFTWQPASSQSFGQVNGGQNFIAGDATGLVSITDAQIAEGDSGNSQMLLTVHRAGGLDQSASVDWTLNFDGTASADDLGNGQPLSGQIDFAPGVSEVRIAVAIAGDTVGEANETFSIALSNPAGNIAITDQSATGTILNDDPIAVTIMQIQGESHTSTYVGQDVTTTGIVTQVGPNGYYLQDAHGDGNSATSDAVYVFTGGPPMVAVGDALEVRGTVAEFAADPGVGLTTTEIDHSTATLLSHGNALPSAVVIGSDGILPPNQVIDDDGLASFDPSHDGIDFFESLEGMRVTIENPLVIQSTNSFVETYVVASSGAGATGVSANGSLTISPGDANPERIQIDSTSGSPVLFTEGDHLGSVTGVIGYSFDEYEVLAQTDPTLVQATTLTRDVTSLHGDADHLSLATYNLENLDASDNKYDILARDMVFNLGAPDIIAVQEVQDDNGTGTGVLSADQNLGALVAAMNALDPTSHYVFAEIDPAAENASGGEPNGNIRNAFIYDANRVMLEAGSLTQITGDEYHNSRNPLVGTFQFNGQDVTVIDIHAYSRGGSDPDFGANQPPVQSGDDRRTAQADGVRSYINDQLATDPHHQFVVTGDFNGFYWEDAISHLTAGAVLTNLSSMLPSEERYSYQFDGNTQEFDHILVTQGLLPGAQYDAVHINSEFNPSTRPTDHDPQVSLLYIDAAPDRLVLNGGSVDENLAAGALVGTLAGHDPDGNSLSYALTNDANGLFAVDQHTGAITTTASLNFEALNAYTITGTATDPSGRSIAQSFTVHVNDVNEAPVATHDSAAVNEDATSGDLYSALLANDSDPDAAAELSISAVDTSGTLGTVNFDPVHHTLTYSADNDLFDALAPGQTYIDHFNYTVTDQGGLTSTASVDVTVTGLDDGISLRGGAGADTLTGTAGEDQLIGDRGNDSLFGLGGHDILDGGQGDDKVYGGDGNDHLYGGAGNDALDGGSGADQLFGGPGDDVLVGGSGADSFHFGASGGSDVVLDFNTAQDALVLDDGVTVLRSKVQDVNHDGIQDLFLNLSQGGSVALLGITELNAVHFGTSSVASNVQTSGIIGIDVDLVGHNLHLDSGLLG